MATFKEQHEELQHIVRELLLVRSHNLGIKQGDPQGKLLHFAEGLLTLLALERFLRAVLGPEAKDKTLPNLLQLATSAKRRLLSIPGTWTRDQAISAMTEVRNTLMHGDYEKAAQGAQRQDVRAYFSGGQYISEVEVLYRLLEDFMQQIDSATGKPRT